MAKAAIRKLKERRFWRWCCRAMRPDLNDWFKAHPIKRWRPTKRPKIRPMRKEALKRAVKRVLELVAEHEAKWPT
jgi:hypothetical protein